MARKNKYSTELLKQYIDMYWRQKNDLSAIQIKDLIEYLHSLGIDVSYSILTRNNPEIKEYIESFKERVTELVVKKDSLSVLPSISFTIDQIKELKTDKQIESFVEYYNEQISKLQNQCVFYSDQYEKLNDEFEVIKQNNETLQNTINQQKEELKKTNESMRKIKQRNKQLYLYKKNSENYLKEYIYNPIVFNHLQDLALLLNEEVVEMPKGVANLIDNEKLLDKVNKFYECFEDIEDDELNDKTKNEIGDSTNGTNHVISKEATKIIDLLESL